MDLCPNYQKVQPTRHLLKYRALTGPHLAAQALWWEDGAVIWLCWVAALMAAATRGQ